MSVLRERRVYGRKAKRTAQSFRTAKRWMAIVDRIPIGCEVNFPETPIRYVDSLPLMSSREHELVLPPRRSGPA